MTALEMLLDGLKPLLKDYGFKQRGKSFLRDTGQSVWIFQLQKSAYGGRIYLNTGVFIKPCGDGAPAVLKNCQVQARLDQLVDQGVLDLDSPVDDRNRLAALRPVLENDPWGFFKALDGVEAIREYIKRSGTHAVTGKARAYLGPAGPRDGSHGG